MTPNNGIWLAILHGNGHHRVIGMGVTEFYRIVGTGSITKNRRTGGFAGSEGPSEKKNETRYDQYFHVYWFGLRQKYSMLFIMHNILLYASKQSLITIFANSFNMAVINLRSFRKKARQRKSVLRR